MTVSYDNGINCVYCHHEIPIESISAGKTSHLVLGQGKSMNQLTLQVTCYDCGKKNYVIWRFEELLPRKDIEFEQSRCLGERDLSKSHREKIIEREL